MTLISLASGKTFFRRSCMVLRVALCFSTADRDILFRASKSKKMESVYNLANTDQRLEMEAYMPSATEATGITPKKRLYQSGFPKEYCTVPKHMHKTLGPAKVNPADHTNWLKKGSGNPPLPQPKRWDYDEHDPLPRKPAVYRQHYYKAGRSGTDGSSLTDGSNDGSGNADSTNTIGCECGGNCNCQNGGACQCAGDTPCHCLLGGTCNASDMGPNVRGRRGCIDSCEGPLEPRVSDKYAKKERAIAPDGQSVPITGLRSNKNFVRANIINATVMVPPPTDKADMDWTEKEGYGQTPKYLAKIKKQVAAEQETIQKIEEKYKGGVQKMAYMLDPVEKEQLLAGIKANWKLLNEEYTTQLKVVQETFGQQNRKMWLEKRLADLENDIAILERETVFVEQS